MSEQAKIMAEIHEMVMSILKTGSATEEQGEKIDELEDLLYQQNCFKEVASPEYANQGEEIASLFFAGATEQGISKMLEYDISPDDFFGFVAYHYDEDHKDEHLVKMFTGAFMADVKKACS